MKTIRMNFSQWSRLLAITLALTVGASSAKAALFTGTSGGVSVSANITLAANTITVTLTNLTQDPISAASLLNGGPIQCDGQH